jgi:hypothetical protein
LTKGGSKAVAKKIDEFADFIATMNILLKSKKTA